MQTNKYEEQISCTDITILQIRDTLYMLVFKDQIKRHPKIGPLIVQIKRSLHNYYIRETLTMSRCGIIQYFPQYLKNIKLLANLHLQPRRSILCEKMSTGTRSGFPSADRRNLSSKFPVWCNWDGLCGCIETFERFDSSLGIRIENVSWLQLPVAIILRVPVPCAVSMGVFTWIQGSGTSLKSLKMC